MEARLAVVQQTEYSSRTIKTSTAYIMKKIPGLVLVVSCFSFILNAQYSPNANVTLSAGEKSIIAVASLTAKGNLSDLKSELNAGLEAGLTINQIKEVMVHLYAYCGFPRSIRGLQTFMEVLDERKANGIVDKMGVASSPIKMKQPKYERGKKVLGELTKAPQDVALTGYAAFAPVIDTFLKEHLFADIFERDVLTYGQRELVTISVLTALGGVEPMLRSHLSICLNTGLTPGQLTEFAGIVKSTAGKKEAKTVRIILDDLLNNNK